MEISLLVTMTIAILAIFLGVRVNRLFPFLKSWNIPAVITGGLIVSVVSLGVGEMLDARLIYDISARDILLLYFFASIGLNIRIADVMEGGKPLVLLLFLMIALILLQNVIAAGAALIFHIPPEFGVLVGSLALSGGHGTAIAWAPFIDAQFGVANSLEIGIGVATLGLIAGSLLGGPIAHVLIERNRLEGPADMAPTVGLPPEVGADYDNDINHLMLLRTIVVIHVAILLGYGLSELLVMAGISIPVFVPVLIMAIMCSNALPLLFPKSKWPAGTRCLALVSDLSLNLFLALTLISVNIMQLVHSGGPLLAIIGLQVLVAVAYIVFLVFPAMGKDYDSAVVASGFTGISLGSTATAFANMSAVSLVHGPSAKAHMLISMVAALFLDLVNSGVVAVLMRFVDR